MTSKELLYRWNSTVSHRSATASRNAITMSHGLKVSHLSGSLVFPRMDNAFSKGHAIGDDNFKVK